MLTSEHIDKIAPAFVKAQAAIEGATKNQTNDYVGNSYADLSAVIDACRKQLADNELAVIQTTDTDDAISCVVIETTLIHTSGQWFRSHLKMPLVNQNPQGVGSALTYGRRYALAAMVGIAQVDDDAESSMVRSKNNQQRSQGNYQAQRQDNRNQSTAKTDPNAPPAISDAQRKELQKLLDQASVSAKEICQKFGIPNLRVLPIAQFDEAVGFLSATREQT